MKPHYNDANEPPLTSYIIEHSCYAYREMGNMQGHTLVLLHGLGETSSRVFWQPLFTRLQQRYHLVAIDIPGFGDSTCPPDAYTPATVAQHLAHMINALAWGTPTLIGHSLGGIIAAKTAIAYPHAIARLILYSTPLPGDVWQNLAIATTMPLAGTLLMTLLTTPLGKWVYSMKRAEDVRLVVDGLRVAHNPAHYTDAMVREGLRSSHDALVAWLQHGFLFENIVRDCKRITMPTLLLRGEFDPTVPAAWTRHTCAMLPHAHHVVIPHAGHNSLNEQPEQWLHAVEAFFAATENDHATSC